MTQVSASTPVADTRQMDVVLWPHPKRDDIQFIELHFNLPDREKPPEEATKWLSDRGWKFLKFRDKEWTPRWGKAESYESWHEAQEFVAQYSDCFGRKLRIEDGTIPEQYRYPAENSVSTEIKNIATDEPTEAPHQIEEVHQETSGALPSQERETTAPEGGPEPMPEPQFSNPQTSLVYGEAMSLLEGQELISDRDIYFAVIKGSEAVNPQVMEKIQEAIAELCAKNILEFYCKADNGQDDLYCHFGQSRMVDQQVVQELEEPPAPESPPEVEEPIEAPMPQPQQTADPFSFFDNLAHFTSGLVEQLEAKIKEEEEREAIRAQRKQQIRDWKPTHPGGYLPWLEFQAGMAIAALTLPLQVAAQPEQEVSPAKKLDAAEEAQPQPPVKAETEPSVAPPAPRKTQKPKAKTRAKKRKSNAASVRGCTIKVDGKPLTLLPGELDETKPFVGCYAELDGQIGLSFRGLVAPLTVYVKEGPFIAQPSTFQPLWMEEFVADRLRAMIKLRRLYQELLDAENTPDLPDPFVEECREALNVAYDAFFENHGTLRFNEALFYFNGQTDFRLLPLLSLEDDETHEKTDIFFRRLVLPPASLGSQRCFHDDPIVRVGDAVAVVIDHTGSQDTIDLDLVAQVAGMDPAEVETILREQKIAFREPKLPGSGHRGRF